MYNEVNRHIAFIHATPRDVNIQLCTSRLGRSWEDRLPERAPATTSDGARCAPMELYVDRSRRQPEHYNHVGETRQRWQHNEG